MLAGCWVLGWVLSWVCYRVGQLGWCISGQVAGIHGWGDLSMSLSDGCPLQPCSCVMRCEDWVAREVGSRLGEEGKGGGVSLRLDLSKMLIGGSVDKETSSKETTIAQEAVAGCSRLQAVSLRLSVSVKGEITIPLPRCAVSATDCHGRLLQATPCPCLVSRPGQSPYD